MSGKTPFHRAKLDRNELQLARLARVKHIAAPETAALGPAMIDFFKHSVAKRQTKFAKVGDYWGQLIPATFLDHCALESFHRGTLTVFVDSASHLYELKQLLLAGLQQQLLLACAPAGLQKIVLKQGRWYESGNDAGDRKVRFT
ncbi:MAG: DUF721 domain-containing protein [Chthoniobacterales bacterium]|nr:DUF721 domain-containing protein [Chthoniobacterales bacterium]